MNIFNFTANFGSEEACRLHFKEERDKIGLAVNVGGKIIFGLRVDGVMNAKNVEVEYHYEAEPLCKVLIYRF